MTDPTLAGRLKTLREQAGLSPRELGSLAGLQSPAHVSMIERGERGNALSATVATALARVLGCTAEHLVDGLGIAPTPAQSLAAVEAARTTQETRRDQ